MDFKEYTSEMSYVGTTCNSFGVQSKRFTNTIHGIVGSLLFVAFMVLVNCI